MSEYSQWTEAKVFSYFESEDFKGLAEAINASIASELNEEMLKNHRHTEEIKRLKQTIEMWEKRQDETALAVDFAEWGWTIIANSSGGDWEKESKDWQVAAAKYRDDFHNTIRKLKRSERCPGPRQHGHPLIYESHCDHGETKAHDIVPPATDYTHCTCHLPEQTECPLHGTGWPQLPEQPPATLVLDLLYKIRNQCDGADSRFDKIKAIIDEYEQSGAKPVTDDRVKEQELEKRISNYLSSGGLFNPELMEHEKVRDLIIDCWDALAAERQKREQSDIREAETEERLLQAQAAIAEHNKRCEPGNFISNIVRPITIDLSALDKHDADREGAAIKRLSDALTGGNASTWDQIFHAAENVAKVKK